MIDAKGEQRGVIPIEEALREAREAGLDLIQVTDKAVPPVCKIMDRGKYIYAQKKKEQKAEKNQKMGELKMIRLSFNISLHDMEIRANQAEKFMKKGDKVKIELVLKGREKALGQFANEKLGKFLEILRTLTPIKIEQELKKQPRGLTMIIAKG